MAATDEILDIADVAELLGMPQKTVRMLRYRDQMEPLANGTRRLPREDWTKSGRPIWRRERFVREAKAMGRL
jgi:hypothetical protein